MKDLGITQEYLLCTLNEKGRIPSLGVEKTVCLVAAGLLELALEGCVSLESRGALFSKVQVCAPLPAGREYLAPLYRFLSAGKPVPLDKLATEYCYTVTDKRWNELLGSVGGSLAALGLVQEEKGGLLGGRQCVLPRREAVALVVDKMRAELMEDGPVTDETVLLVNLLDKSGSLKTYFSKFERAELKEKLEGVLAAEEGRVMKEMVDYIANMIAIITGVICAST